MQGQQEVKNFQQNLSSNQEDKKHYVDAENQDSDYSSDDEITEQCHRKGPRCDTNYSVKNRGKGDSINFLLMDQLVEQQKNNLKAQKKIFQLKNTIDVADVKDRYLKLDLNNAEVRVAELTEKLSDVECQIKFVTVEKNSLKVLILLYLMYIVGSYVYKFFQ